MLEFLFNEAAELKILIAVTSRLSNILRHIICTSFSIKCVV